MGHDGEIRADQGHRGYTTSTDADGFSQLNPLYMVRARRLTTRIRPRRRIVSRADRCNRTFPSFVSPTEIHAVAVRALRRAARVRVQEHRGVRESRGGDKRRDRDRRRSVRQGRARDRGPNRASHRDVRSRARQARSPHAGPRTTASAWCTPFLKDVTRRAFLSARAGPSLVSIPTHAPRRL
jgi:hypothetical protein